MEQTAPVPLASREPLPWVCTREGAFVLLGDRFHLLAGTEGRHVLTAGHHPRGRFFLATPTQLMELVGSQAHRVKNLKLTTMAVDRKGEVWLGTESGLVRYIGSEFREYSGGRHLPDSRIRGLAEDSEGHLYVGTEKGLGVFDRPRWLTISWEWPIRCLDRSPTGRVWAGFEGGAACFRGLHRVERLEAGELPAMPLSIVDDIHGSTWFSFGERGLWRRNAEGELRRVPLQGEAPDTPAPRPVTKLLADPAGPLYAAVPGVGLARVSWGRVQFLGLAEGLVSSAIEGLGYWPTPA